MNAPYHSSIVVSKPAEGSQGSNDGSYTNQERKFSLNPRYHDGKQQSAGSSVASHPGRSEEIKSNTTPMTHSVRSNSTKSGDDDRSAASKVRAYSIKSGDDDRVRTYSIKSGDEKPTEPNYVRSSSTTSKGKQGSVGQPPGQPSVHETSGHRLSAEAAVVASDKDSPASPPEAGKTII